MARDRARTEQKILAAVGAILAEPGGSRRLGVNAIAERSGVDKVLIYRYFGGLDGLLAAFADKADLWPGSEETVSSEPSAELATALAALVQGYIAALRRRPATLEAIAWEMSERTALSGRLESLRAQWRRDATARVFRDHKVPAKVDIEAVMAVLAAAADHLAARGRLGGDFYGVALDDPAGQRRLDAAFAAILEGVLNYARVPPAGGRNKESPRAK
jgi:AcrR family transcriptional regulator